MGRMKQQFEREKEQLQKVHAPKELESRLRNRLDHLPNQKQRRSGKVWRRLAALIIISILIGYNYQSLAYYGKKIIGYDHVISNTLQQLNDSGMGQTINKSITFEDGTTFTIDGIIVDKNQLIMFYTLESPSSIVKNTEYDHQPINITGFLTNASHESGMGEVSEDEKVIRGTHSFETPNGFAKELTVHFHETTETLTFSYNPEKAMGHTIKQTINEKVILNEALLTFQTIEASPTSTIIKGKGDKELIESLNFEQMELIVNGEKINLLSNGYSTNITGTTFEITYDAIPTDSNPLEVTLHLPNDQVLKIYRD